MQVLQSYHKYIVCLWHMCTLYIYTFCKYFLIIIQCTTVDCSRYLYFVMWTVVWLYKVQMSACARPRVFYMLSSRYISRSKLLYQTVFTLVQYSIVVYNNVYYMDLKNPGRYCNINFLRHIICIYVSIKTISVPDRFQSKTKFRSAYTIYAR